MKVALLGAESTGKTQLAQALAVHWRAAGRRAEAVPEALRDWCAAMGRTPRPEEQMAIAQEQERRVDEAAARADIVIADTTALMVAVYSAMLFEDGSLYRYALERQRGYTHTLLTGLDLPWVADGLFRDGPHVQGPIDAQVREILARAGLPYRVVYGQGEDRLKNALAAIEGHPEGEIRPRLAWTCEKCSDPDCEHRLFTGLVRGS